MLEAADPKSLILIDEIGAATDPQQGSALAQAIREQLADLGVKGIVTTHYTALKVFAESHPGCINASMQFDLKSLIPTYRFSTGIPGDSFAIEVAASLGMNKALIERAKGLAGSQNMEFTTLLKKLQEEKKNLAKQSYEFELKTRNLEARITEAESREQEWQKELKTRRQHHLKELQGELISFQKLYNREISEIKNLDKEERKRLSERKLHDISAKTEELSRELMQGHADGLQPLTNPKVGERVWLANFDAEAIILEVQGKSAKVDMNGISFKTEIGNLYAPKTADLDKVKPLSRVRTVAKAQTELKLLGLTFDEAMPLIDEFLDNAALAGFSTLRIVHGKGTGVLRAKVQHYLSRKKMVKSMETPLPYEGGNGVTVVKL
jgi:DNA mismatch repair protein MutS2